MCPGWFSPSIFLTPTKSVFLKTLYHKKSRSVFSFVQKCYFLYWFFQKHKNTWNTVLFHLSKTARNVQSGIISKNTWNVQGLVSFQRTLGMFRMVPYHALKSKVYIMNKSSECYLWISYYKTCMNPWVYLSVSFKKNSTKL